MAMKEDERMSTRDEMKASSRYPYTYAADWVRMAGLADSRADASRWRKAVDVGDMDDAEFAALLANQYIDYWVAVEAADNNKTALFNKLKAMAKVTA